jgi:hypothetical protein
LVVLTCAVGTCIAVIAICVADTRTVEALIRGLVATLSGTGWSSWHANICVTQFGAVTELAIIAIGIYQALQAAVVGFVAEFFGTRLRTSTAESIGTDLIAVTEQVVAAVLVNQAFQAYVVGLDTELVRRTRFRSTDTSAGFAGFRPVAKFAVIAVSVDDATDTGIGIFVTKLTRARVAAGLTGAGAAGFRTVTERSIVAVSVDNATDADIRAFVTKLTRTGITAGLTGAGAAGFRTVTEHAVIAVFVHNASTASPHAARRTGPEEDILVVQENACFTLDLYAVRATVCTASAAWYLTRCRLILKGKYSHTDILKINLAVAVDIATVHGTATGVGLRTYALDQLVYVREIDDAVRCPARRNVCVAWASRRARRRVTRGARTRILSAYNFSAEWRMYKDTPGYVRLSGVAARTRGKVARIGKAQKLQVNRTGVQPIDQAVTINVTTAQGLPANHVRLVNDAFHDAIYIYE